MSSHRSDVVNVPMAVDLVEALIEHDGWEATKHAGKENRRVDSCRMACFGD